MHKFGSTGIAEYYGVLEYNPHIIQDTIKYLESNNGSLFTFKNSYFILEYFKEDNYVMGTFYIALGDANLDDIQELIGRILGSKHSIFTSIARGLVTLDELDLEDQEMPLNSGGYLH